MDPITTINVTRSISRRLRELNGHAPLLTRYEFVAMLCEAFEQTPAKMKRALYEDALKKKMDATSK